MNISRDNINGVKNIPGTNVTSCIAPCTEEDNYATHDSIYGKGGWREVRTIEERNAIPIERRKLGMAVWVTQLNKLYILKYAFNNTCWYEFNSTDVSDIINAAIDAGQVNVDVASCVSQEELDRRLGKYNTAAIEEINISKAKTAIISELKNWVEEQQYLKEHQSLEGYATEQFVQESVGAAVGEIEDELIIIKGDVDDLKIDNADLKNFKDSTVTQLDLINSEIETINEFISGGESSQIEVATKEQLDALAQKEEEDYGLLRDNVSLIAETYDTKEHVTEVHNTLDEGINNLANAVAARPTLEEVNGLITANNADLITREYLRGFATESFVKDYVARVMDGTVEPGQPYPDYATQIAELQAQIAAMQAEIDELKGN